MGNSKASDDGFADFKSAAANGDFNPRGDTVAGEHGREEKRGDSQVLVHAYMNLK